MWFCTSVSTTHLSLRFKIAFCIYNIPSVFPWLLGHILGYGTPRFSHGVKQNIYHKNVIHSLFIRECIICLFPHLILIHSNKYLSGVYQCQTMCWALIERDGKENRNSPFPLKVYNRERRDTHQLIQKVNNYNPWGVLRQKSIGNDSTPNKGVWSTCEVGGNLKKTPLRKWYLNWSLRNK